MAIDLFTEPDGDPDTLANLGPLRALAGIWQGQLGHDEHPVDGGGESAAFIEHYTAQPIDYQTNGPQLLYGLRYHTHIVQPGEVAMFHDQVGYWLWEPATKAVMLTVAIPRGQVALASGHCAADATTFTVTAQRGQTTDGIASNPFLDTNFTTTDFEMTVTVHSETTWSYDEVTHLVIPDRPSPFEHVDRHTLQLVSPPTPNPLAAAAKSAQ